MSVQRAQAIINDVTINLTKNTTTGKWEATATAPAKSSYTQPEHYYGVILKAWDEAGNLTSKDVTDSTLGTALQLVTKENVAPNITITYPTANAVLINNKPVIHFRVTDNDSGVNPDTIKVTIDSGAAIISGIDKTVIEGGYDCTYTPTAALADGAHTIKINTSDYDGNAATQKSVTFKIDTVPPALSVTSPVNNAFTNNASCTVEGTTNDITSSPCIVTVKLNSGTAETVTDNDNGAFSKVVTLATGINTITIVSTDGAGKSTTVTRTVTLDTTPPIISAVSIMPNPVDAGKTFTISVTITD